MVAGITAWFKVDEYGTLIIPDVPSKRYPVAPVFVGLGIAPTVGIGEPATL
jgi:hypothetical protein